MILTGKELLHLLGHEPIDSDHRTFIELLKQIEKSDSIEFVKLFARLEEHLHEHFEREDQIMEQYSYPAVGEHRGEHQRVLGELAQFRQRVEKGRVVFGRTYALEQLPNWFNLHVTTMDAALAEFAGRKNKE